MLDPSARRLVCALPALLLIACQTVPRPGRDQTFSRGPALVGLESTSPVATMTLLDNGLWAATWSGTPRRQADPDYPVGALVHLSADADDAPLRNIMRVRASADWGLLLEHLSDVPLDPTMDHFLTRIPGDDPRLCTGSGDPREAACIKSASAGTRFTIWRSAPSPSPTSNSALDAPLSSAHKHHDGAVELSTPTDAPWLALPLRGKFPTPPVSHVAYATSCAWPDAVTASSHVAPADLDESVTSHPLLTAQAAMKHHVDALVTCSGSNTSIASAGLWRPWITTREPRQIGPALLSARQIVLPSDDPAALAKIAEAMGVAAQGDAHWAAALLTPYTDTSSELALGAAQLHAPTAPERALGLARAATTDSWNRNERLDYSAAQVAIWASIQDSSTHLSEEAALIKRARSRRDGELIGWVEWWQFATALERGEVSSFTRLEDMDTLLERDADDATRLWHLARLLDWARTNDLDELTTRRVRARAESLGVLELHDALMQSSEAPSRAHPHVTAYGANTTALTLDAFIRARRARLPWDFAAHASEDLDALQLAMLHYFHPTSSPLTSRAYQAAGAELARRDDGWCADAKTLGVELEHRLRGSDSRSDNALVYLYTKYAPAMCADEPLDALSPPKEHARHVSAALEAQLLATPSGQKNHALLEALARSATTRRCRDANIALAIAALDAGQIQRAKKSLVDATNCKLTERDEDLDRELEIASATIYFEQYGKLPGKLSPELRARLDTSRTEKLDAICPALSATSHNPRALLPPRLLHMAGRAKPDAPASDFEVLTASQLVKLGEEARGRANAALERGDTHAAAKEFLAARQLAQQAADTPARTQLYFIEQILFDKDFEKHLKKSTSEATPEGAPSTDKDKDKDDDPRDILTRARSGEARVVLEELAAIDPLTDQELELYFALLLTQRRRDEVIRTLEARDAASKLPGLCELDGLGF